VYDEEKQINDNHNDNDEDEEVEDFVDTIWMRMATWAGISLSKYKIYQICQSNC
jgi:hypothetical protein